MRDWTQCFNSTFSVGISSLRHIQDALKFPSSRSFKLKSVTLFVMLKIKHLSDL